MILSSVIKKLVDVAIPEFYHALSMLFVSASSIQRVNVLGGEIPVVIELTGDVSKAREAMSFAKHKLLRKLHPFLLDATQQPQIILPQTQPDLLRKLLGELGKTDWSKMEPEVISRVAVSQVVVLSDLTVTEGNVAESLSHFIEKYDQQPSALRDKNTVRLLSGPKLRLIEPRMQIAVCPNCYNFELIVSTYVLRERKCPQCKNSQVAIRIYIFNDLYFKHKSKNKDLPLFIKEYLSQQAPRIRVHAFKKIRPVIEGKIQEGDIDVYIQESQTGFECKLFLNPTPEESQMRNYVDEVFEDIRKYIYDGVKRIVVVTNLSEKDAQSMSRRVLLKLKEANLSLDYFEALPDSVHKLLQLLVKEAEYSKSLLS